jgi:plasmid stabilization system protein ParE
MKVIVRESAAVDLEDIFAWISKDNPRAAIEMVERIRLRINRLAFGGLIAHRAAGAGRGHAREE